MMTCNRLKGLREGRGFSAALLANRAGVSRQTIYAIEDGSFVPNTAISLQLARTLEVTVEEIFSLEDERPSQTVRAEFVGDPQLRDKGQLVQLCRVNDRVVAIPTSSIPAYLPRAEGVIQSSRRETASIRTSGEVPENGKRLLIAGCDPALSLLTEFQLPGVDVITLPVASGSALKWLKEGKVHAAGSHLLDRATGDYNLPIIHRLFPKDTVRVMTFAAWEQGLVLGRGNPKAIRSIADLGRRDVTVMNRPKGSGSRDLLDTGLRKAGIPVAQVKGYRSTAQGHLAAAHAVAAGWADCCVACQSAARCFGLEFVPLAVERFDLSFAKDALALPAARALLDLLNRSRLRRKLETVAGYDTSHTGQQLL